MRIQEYNEPRLNEENEKPTRLAPIIEFQREYRLGKATSSSTRIRYDNVNLYFTYITYIYNYFYMYLYIGMFV